MRGDINVHIAYNFKSGPWGGGNQFLRALRKIFREWNVYTDDLGEADAVIVNSHHSLVPAVRAKRRRPTPVIVHRIDGPVYDIRQGLPVTDRIIYGYNRRLADGTIFQSDWSMNRNRHHGLDPAPHEATIVNAPDPSLFNRERPDESPGDRIRLIATSWSANMRKGFDVYGYLDQHLDFNRYEFTFVGNSPIPFENVNWVDPVPSREVAQKLKAHDIFITASRSDPCSNALIEALHCGLPAVARNDGGHPELVGGAGELFTSGPECIRAIEKVAGDLDGYREKIDLPTFETVGRKYLAFTRSVVEESERGTYDPKRLEGIEARTYPMKLRGVLAARYGLNKLPIEVA